MRLVCAQAVGITIRPGSSGSHFITNSIRTTFASTSTGRRPVQFHRTRSSPVFASGSNAAAAAAAPQSATEVSAATPESEAPQFPLSAAVVAAAAAALAAGRDLLAAAEAVDESAVILTVLAYAGASLREMSFVAALASDPLLLIFGIGGGAAGIWLGHMMGLIGHDSPRSAAFNSAGRTYWVWQLAWHLTGAFLPVRLASSSVLQCPLVCEVFFTSAYDQQTIRACTTADCMAAVQRHGHDAVFSSVEHSHYHEWACLTFYAILVTGADVL
jgi:hypothetical protein